MNRIPSGTYDTYLKTLIDISRTITSEKYLDDILNLIVTVAANVTDIKICSLWLIDESEHPAIIRLKASQAIDKEYVNNQALTLSEGVVGHVASHKQPIMVEDVLKHPQFKEKKMARKSGLVSMLGIPMQDKSNRLIGVLNCFTTQPHTFSKTEVDLMTTLAGHAAVVIHNTELMIRSRLIQEELDTCELVEQARSVLMEQRKMEDSEAYGWIIKCSHESQKNIRQVAEAILLAN